MRELVEVLAQSLVDHPEEVTVQDSVRAQSSSRRYGQSYWKAGPYC